MRQMGPDKFEAKTDPEETGAERGERADARDPFTFAVIGRGFGLEAHLAVRCCCCCRDGGRGRLGA